MPAHDPAKEDGAAPGGGFDVLNAVTGKPINDVPLTVGEAQRLAGGGRRRPGDKLPIRPRPGQS